MSRQSSGNPNPTNSPQPFYEGACRLVTENAASLIDIFRTFWALGMKFRMDYSDGKGRFEVAEHRRR